MCIETSIKEKQAKERDKEVENKKKKEIEEATKQRVIQREIQRNEVPFIETNQSNTILPFPYRSMH